MHKRAAEANMAQRQAFKDVAKYIPAHHLWFMDESAVVRMINDVFVKLKMVPGRLHVYSGSICSKRAAYSGNASQFHNFTECKFWHSDHMGTGCFLWACYSYLGW
jgi:hypothetical protein